MSWIEAKKAVEEISETAVDKKQTIAMLNALEEVDATLKNLNGELEQLNQSTTSAAEKARKLTLAMAAAIAIQAFAAVAQAVTLYLQLSV